MENNPSINKKRKAVFVFLITILLFWIYFNWINIAPTHELGKQANQTGNFILSKHVVKDSKLTIESLNVDVDSLGTNVKLYIKGSIENLGDENLSEASIIIPWPLDENPHLVSNIETNKKFNYKTEFVEYVLTSTEATAIPIQYKTLDKSYSLQGISLTKRKDDLSYLHNFGTEIDIIFDKPIETNAEKSFFISFSLDGAVYDSSSNYLLDKIKPSPINFYPLNSKSRLKTYLIFPFAKEVHLENVIINLPFDHSATPYEAPEFEVASLNLQLKPKTAEGFVMWFPPEKLNRESCADIISTMYVCDEQYEKCLQTEKGCVLSRTNFPLTNEITNNSERWYLRASYPAARNKLYLMKFVFNPSAYPSFNKQPGMLTLLVDYKLNWWVFLIPSLIIISILSITFGYEAREEQKTNKIMLLIPFILALFSHWALSFNTSPPVHPNLLDLTYFLTLLISIMYLIVGRDVLINLAYIFIVVFGFAIFGMNNKFLGDFFIKISLIYPLIAFSIYAYWIFVVPFLGFAFKIRSANLREVLYWVWILKFLVLALTFPLLYKYLQKKINKKFNKFVTNFLSSYISFLITWYPLTLVLFILRTTTNFWRDLVFFPLLMGLLITTLLMIQTEINKWLNLDQSTSKRLFEGYKRTIILRYQILINLTLSKSKKLYIKLKEVLKSFRKK